MVIVQRYDQVEENNWNDFNNKSVSACFLFDRLYMDYHHDRFEDFSLIFKEKERICQLFPAHIDKSRATILSHGGLTYGGLIGTADTTTQNVGRYLQQLASVYWENGCKNLIYKPIPYIYKTYPSEADLYWLFRAEAQLTARTVSSAIDLSAPLLFSKLRKRKVGRALRAGLSVEECNGRTLPCFWEVLNDVLAERHATHPVHSLPEIKLLHSRFPHNIKTFGVYAQGNIVAGATCYFTQQVIHVQYIAVNEEGRMHGALDLLFQILIERYAMEGKYRFFDFGISTEAAGKILNTGLLFQKEGFGGRAVCYDTYSVSLEKLKAIKL